MTQQKRDRRSDQKQRLETSYGDLSQRTGTKTKVKHHRRRQRRRWIPEKESRFKD